jgi:hypothetical protein
VQAASAARESVLQISPLLKPHGSFRGQVTATTPFFPNLATQNTPGSDNSTPPFPGTAPLSHGRSNPQVDIAFAVSAAPQDFPLNSSATPLDRHSEADVFSGFQASPSQCVDMIATLLETPAADVLSGNERFSLDTALAEARLALSATSPFAETRLSAALQALAPPLTSPPSFTFPTFTGAHIHPEQVWVHAAAAASPERHTQRPVTLNHTPTAGVIHKGSPAHADAPRSVSLHPSHPTPTHDLSLKATPQHPMSSPEDRPASGRAAQAIQNDGVGSNGNGQTALAEEAERGADVMTIPNDVGEDVVGGEESPVEAMEVEPSFGAQEDAGGCGGAGAQVSQSPLFGPGGPPGLEQAFRKGECCVSFRLFCTPRFPCCLMDSSSGYRKPSSKALSLFVKIFWSTWSLSNHL